jgi:peptidoglycan/xylan/chitin deacetylase (PgdA/CDA1 family)
MTKKDKSKSKVKAKAETKAKVKAKAKAKVQSHRGDKTPPPLKVTHSVGKTKLPHKIFSKLSRHKRYWPLAILIILVLVACLIWYLPQSWLIRASFSQTITYPKVSVLGVNLGSLNTNQLDSRLARLKSEFEIKKITLVNDKKQWVYGASKLGVTIDAQATARAVWRLNDLGLIDSYRLLTGGTSSVVEPIVLVDDKMCVKSLSVISIPEVKPIDALVYFDQELKIKPDQTGTKFSATLTCQELPKILAANLYVTDVSFDTTLANLTKANLESKLSQIQAIASKSLILKSGTYEQTLTSKQLFDLLEISKDGSEVKVDWSLARLDELVGSIAAKVDTNNSSPALGACQSLVSTGGNWLDKTATKKIFTDLGADSLRNYTLPIIYHAPVISNISPVVGGNSGIIYLTFDDGLTYGNQIMNYAACYGVKVTFFELGTLANRDASALRRAIAEGHAVQSHGYEHALYDYGARSYDWQYNDINQSINAITSVTGVRPTYFRPPGGNRNASTYDATSANGVSLILWGVSSGDGASIGTSATCSNVLARAFAGASVLLHSSKGDTAAAVPCIIEGLAARGYNMQALR